MKKIFFFKYNNDFLITLWVASIDCGWGTSSFPWFLEPKESSWIQIQRQWAIRQWKNLRPLPANFYNLQRCSNPSVLFFLKIKLILASTIILIQLIRKKKKIIYSLLMQIPQSSKAWIYCPCQRSRQTDCCHPVKILAWTWEH